MSAPQVIKATAQASLGCSLVMHRLSAYASDRPPLVLIHGWGADSSSWGDWPYELSKEREVWLLDLPGFGASPAWSELADEDYSLTGLLTQMHRVLPEHCELLGWSLGGMLATAYASTYPERVASLTCLASNACFAQRPGWDAALEASVYQGFMAGYESNPAKCLKRFQALEALGDSQERALLQSLRAVATVPTGDWLAALRLLGELDNRECLASLQVPTKYIFGEEDHLVPATAAQAIAELNPQINTQVLPGVAHALHLSAPEKLRPHFVDKPCEEQSKAAHDEATHAIDKRAIAESFSSAAQTYDKAAHLQRAIGQQAFELWQDTPVVTGDTAVTHALDLGCGTGAFLPNLQQRYPQAHVFGLDLAQGMLNFACDKVSECGWLCGDAEQLPLANASIDRLFSNLTLQWCRRLDELAKELFRVLRPGGIAVFTSLGPGTLKELEAAWAQVDGHTHVNQFSASNVWQTALCNAGFEAGTGVQVIEEERVVEYQHALELSRELKALGAHNLNSGRASGLTGKQRIQTFIEAYEGFRNAETGLLPATWQVIYVRLQKPKNDLNGVRS